MSSIPPFASLPLDPNGPAYNAWGLYGPDDELGTLNLITPDAVKRGRDAIVEGKAISLNLPMNARSVLTRRDTFEHKIFAGDTMSNDDIVTFNTQVTTQWDGLRHCPFHDFPTKGDARFYMGMTWEESRDAASERLGVQNYAKHPITTRAHLLDVPLLLEKHAEFGPWDATSGKTSRISAEMLEACSQMSGITWAPGDVCVLRTGFTEAVEALTDEQFRAKQPFQASGVDQGEAIFKWHWERGIAAVATDTIGYEASPKTMPMCHNVFLASWGMPIGELFDLRELAQECQKRKNWTFFFTSMPLVLVGGIASPANAQAIL